MSLAVTMVNSSQGMSPSKAMFLMRPRGAVLRTVVPNSIPGNVRSSTYCAWPVTFRRPSLRGVDLPTMLVAMLDHFANGGLDARLRSFQYSARLRGAYFT